MCWLLCSAEHAEKPLLATPSVVKSLKPLFFKIFLVKIVICTSKYHLMIGFLLKQVCFFRESNKIFKQRDNYLEHNLLLLLILNWQIWPA